MVYARRLVNWAFSFSERFLVNTKAAVLCKLAETYKRRRTARLVANPSGKPESALSHLNHRLNRAVLCRCCSFSWAASL